MFVMASKGAIPYLPTVTILCRGSCFMSHVFLCLKMIRLCVCVCVCVFLFLLSIQLSEIVSIPNGEERNVCVNRELEDSQSERHEET